jgi:hypothetical protein
MLRVLAPLVTAERPRLRAQAAGLPPACTSRRSLATTPRPLATPRRDAHLLREKPHLLDEPPISAQPYLLHWTRAPSGSWPDETEDQFWHRQLFLGLQSPTPGATLLRIATQQRLIASRRALRGGPAAICFTSRTLDELAASRVFRRHRGRWDAQPYGVGIQRQWLVAHGARPVIYGQDDDFDKLAPDDRPFFQRHFSQLPAGNLLDWSPEQEWRILGDIRLDRLDPSFVFLFVPNLAEAWMLRGASRWPIVVVGERGEGLGVRCGGEWRGTEAATRKRAETPRTT